MYGGHAYCNLLENMCTPLIKSRVCQLPQNVSDRPYVRAFCSQPINTSSPHSSWPMRSRQRSPYLVWSDSLEHISLSAFCVALNPLVRCLSHLPVFSSLLHFRVRHLAWRLSAPLLSLFLCEQLHLVLHNKPLHICLSLLSEPYRIHWIDK